MNYKNFSQIILSEKYFYKKLSLRTIVLHAHATRIFLSPLRGVFNFCCAIRKENLKVMDKKFFRVFRAGKYPQGTISVKDINEIASSYDPQYHEAPLTVNHDDWSPALAVVEEVKAEGTDLLVSFKDVADEAYAANKKFKRPSVEIVDYDFGDVTKKYLRAVTLTNFPQVKSMDKIQFGENSTFFFMEDLTLNLIKGKKMFNEKIIALAQKLGLDTKTFTAEDELILKCTESVETLQAANQSVSESLTKFTEAGITVEGYQEKLTKWDQENAKVVALEGEIKQFKEERLNNLKTVAIATKDILSAFGSVEAFTKHVDKFAEHSEFSEVKAFVDNLKAKPGNPPIKGPVDFGDDKKFFKADGKPIVYEDLLRDPSLASKFSEEERAELKKKSETFKS